MIENYTLPQYHSKSSFSDVVILVFIQIGLWRMVAHSIKLLQQGIHNPEVLEEFKQFLRQEAKATIEQSEFYEYPWRRTEAHLKT